MILIRDLKIIILSNDRLDGRTYHGRFVATGRMEWPIQWSVLRMIGSSVMICMNHANDLYELSEDCILIVLIENLNEKIFVFDMQDGKKIIRKILNFD